MTLIVNGTESTSLSDIEPHHWNASEDQLVYLGRSSSHFLTGLLDDVRVYDISVTDADLPDVWQRVAFSNGAMKEHLKVYFCMNDDTDYS